MTLSFEEKKRIFDSYAELESAPVSLKRLNYHFKGSAVAKTVVVRNLHPNGNALIYAGYLPKEETQKGYVSVLEEDEAGLREWVDKAIAHLKKTEDGYEDGYYELWFDANGEALRLTYENPIWSVLLADGQVEGIFKTKEAGEGYLHDEGFQKG
ncbi:MULTISPECIES: hypothetical protein [unclassified Jeotgalibaca]|uniref:hypothetical protein n=1 Tax=unclassified Jeotgalibaca TaxID=2621505 RepID=UPI003FD3CCCB